ncbi:MAG: 30S ribosomal protein S3 [Candidatus Pacebacteria bacterium]|nr:30S ribosomal protein S3 [Candidatus Paceibacterota bacterium]MCD8508078.1 30S ribosomal protein S3 [Candidatus Paceibacterota bacterium]MCD8528212.1 30S ribosomal protein S3 [Candidatus Paceibacterota bacterium]MCD8563851.1 30S ribosomal protein S3 [Candidatus Paceibacterota bacterium]
MSHNVHPYAHRLVTLRDWKSRWFAGNKKNYTELLRADILIREYLEKKLRSAYVADIEIERSRKATRIIIHTSRPGMVIGRQGEGAKKIRQDLLTFMKKNNINTAEDFRIDIAEVANPDANAKIVSHMIVEALEKRMPFRRVLKQTLDKVMAVRGVKGAKISLSGRLGGAEMSRKEELKKGGVPLQFIRGDIDYATNTARLSYGGIGIKVWIYKGDSLEQGQK